LGAGHTVTALYEVIPVDSKSEQAVASSSDLKYQTTTVSSNNTDLMTVKFRYKKPKESSSILLEKVLKKSAIPDLSASSNNFRFSAAVAAFGMLLRDSEFKANADYDMVQKLAKDALGQDQYGYRNDFVQLAEQAALIHKASSN
jgi:Ca-activated chloride channel family protein